MPDEAATSVAPQFVPGHFPSMPADVYFSIDAMSQSGAKEILRSPAHFRLQRTKPRAPTDAMQFGTAVHDGVLEPDAFHSRVVEAPEINRRTKAGKQEYAEFCAANAGRIVLDPDDLRRAYHCIDAVRAHPSAAKLLEGAIVETSLFWIDGKHRVPCKARLDVRNHGGITDLKTTQDASPEAFAKSIANFGYDMQAAVYFSGCEHVLDSTPEFYAFIAVESEPPYCVATYVLGSASILAGARRYETALERYAEALAAGKWRGYSDKVVAIDTPQWARKFN